MQTKRVFGIDLGTTYSCISYVDEHGRPTIIPNAENNLTTPSVVYFEDETSIVVGQTAKDVAKVYSDRVVQTVKREMGSADWIMHSFGTDRRPQDISALILRKVVEDAEQNLGEKIEDVVITCPAYFGSVEKEATRQAGEIAGLNVRFIIPEPVAAAIAYGMASDKDQTILVYDLGGGTFDVTLLSVTGASVNVLATGGDHHLGGKDWDEDLVGFFVQKFSETTGASPDDILNDPDVYQGLLLEAERSKITLTSRSVHKTNVQSSTERAMIEISRDDFDQLTRPRLERTIDLTRDIIERGSRKGIEIDAILLVGGSTFMPQVEARLKEEFSYPLLRKDPNQIVAKGAALFGFKCQLDEQIKVTIAEQTGTTAGTVDLGAVSDSTKANAIETIAGATGVPVHTLRGFAETSIQTVSSKSFGLVVVNHDECDVVQNMVQVDDPLPRLMTRTFGTYEDNQRATGHSPR